MVPIVDCRSGRRVRVGEWVRYPLDFDATTGLPLPSVARDDDWKLVGVCRVGLFSAELEIGRQHGRGLAIHRQPCPVRWFHPAGGGAWRVILVPT